MTINAKMSQRYRIERYLTEGGMGAIYVGKKVGPGGFEKEVVLKQLLPEYTERPEFRDLFFREAKISGTLDHANIVHTFDLVQSDAALFIVMEYVRGADLRSIMRRAKIRRRELSPAGAVHIALEILAGLAYAHARRSGTDGSPLGIIHRDVSPSNILCSAQGEVKLSDFGIAKAATHNSAFYRVRGKVGYMSPEQARNETIDSRSDLYSLTVCLYEALAGERLFVGDLTTPPEEIYGQPLPRVSDRRPSVPAALDTVLAKALSPNTDARFQDAASLSEALRNVAHKHGLLFSAPQLASHLSEILGNDADRWLHEDADLSKAANTEKIALNPQARGLAGREAVALGVVDGSGSYVLEDGDLIRSESGVMLLSSRDAVIDEDDAEDDDAALDQVVRSVKRRPGGAPAPRSPGPQGKERTPTDLFSVAPPKSKAAGPPLLRKPLVEPKGGGIRLVDDDDNDPTVARDDAMANLLPKPLEKERAPLAKRTMFGMPAPVVPLPAGKPAGPPRGLGGPPLEPPSPSPLLPPPLERPLEPPVSRPPLAPLAPPAPSLDLPPPLTRPAPFAPPAPLPPPPRSPPASFSFENQTPAIDPDDVSFVEEMVSPLEQVAGPPRWLSAFVLLAASLAGAGVAHLATRHDVPVAVAAPVVKR